MATDNKSEAAEKYNRLKEYDGKRYSGMKVGGTHKWYYDKGEWRERKVTPDEWDIYYSTIKRRAGKAPAGTGAPVGTQYNWLIVSHQRVDKLDANSYMTRMEGKKFKVAHKRAGKDKWSTTEKTQRKRVIAFLEQVIQDLKEADEAAAVPYTIGKAERIYGLEQMNKSELYELAAERDISNRSEMSREELEEAIRQTLNGHEPGPATDATGDNGKSGELSEKSRDELYEMAKARNIKGRSEMKKEELLIALSE